MYSSPDLFLPNMLCNSCQTPGKSIHANPITHKQTGAFGKIIEFFWPKDYSLMKKCGCVKNRNQWRCESNCRNGSGSDMQRISKTSAGTRTDSIQEDD